jgi:hypothetical protein
MNGDCSSLFSAVVGWLCFVVETELTLEMCEALSSSFQVMPHLNTLQLEGACFSWRR